MTKDEIYKLDKKLEIEQEVLTNRRYDLNYELEERHQKERKAGALRAREGFNGLFDKHNIKIISVAWTNYHFKEQPSLCLDIKCEGKWKDLGALFDSLNGLIFAQIIKGKGKEVDINMEISNEVK